jgi:putative ABC transport system permease protein
LGPSGCGKTTLLNVIGGLDHYDSGDLIIGNISTKKFTASDWDAYRNRSIGFVFQNYNLISHQSVLQNVEISMTLAGVSSGERKKRAIEVLDSVGLADQIRKKPLQMSGGQMQRVAIARALVNNPDIILADEPTGALDSHTSVQIMEILKEIAKTRLVIMVTHNKDLAEKYSSRVIQLLDGEVISDSNPIENESKEESLIDGKKAKLKKTSMSLKTAATLSYKNLLMKKGRTIITAFAGSIGIISVALVLAISAGLSVNIKKVQTDALANYPITIGTTAQPLDYTNMAQYSQNNYTKFPSDNVLYNYDRNANSEMHTNVLTQDYLDYIAKLPSQRPNTVINISYTRNVDINLLAKGGNNAVKFNTSAPSRAFMNIVGNNSIYWQELPDNNDFVLSGYDLIGDGSRMPETENEVLLVVDQYNRIDKDFFDKLGMESGSEYKLTDFIGKTILKVIPNNDFYTEDQDGIFTQVPASKYEDLYNNKGIPLTITGILRQKDGSSSAFLSEGIAYTVKLTDYVVQNASQSDIAIAQKDSDIDVILNKPFTDDDTKKTVMQNRGADTTPVSINIYPKDFNSKNEIKTYLDDYNSGKDINDQVIYTDLAELATNLMGNFINNISNVLIAFSAISLIVSSIMIGIITYVSVIERTKEIGILRSVGARKKDVSMVFNAETLIIGFVAGFIGILISYLLSIPINILIAHFAQIDNLAQLPIYNAVLLILGSMVLTLIAGLIPSMIAANKDPVDALRTE